MLFGYMILYSDWLICVSHRWIILPHPHHPHYILLSDFRVWELE
jgi:hypothetical protein